MPTKSRKSNAVNTQLVRRPRVPRRQFSTNGDNTIITSKYISTSPLTILTGATIASTLSFVNPAQTSSLDPGQAIAWNFSNYLVRSATLTYTPAVGTTTLGTVFMAYIDNPEIISKVVTGTYSAATIGQLAQSGSNSTSLPVWQQGSLTMNRPPRRKLFSIDSTTVSSTLEVDRVHQGAFIVAYFGPAAAGTTILGHLSIKYTALLENPQASYVSAV